VDSVIVKILRYVSYISGVCLILIMFVAFFNVLGEKILHKGIPASTEIIQYLHIPVVFLACGYVTLDTGHTKIDLLSKHFPKWPFALIFAIGFFLLAFSFLWATVRLYVKKPETEEAGK
jgi:TRAP-type C4-dicarboxylate transport system permease small subunit